MRRSLIRTIAAIQLWGSVTGIIAVLGELRTTDTTGAPWETLSFLCLGAALFTLGGAGGVGLLRNHRFGRVLTVFAQIPQLFQVSIAGCSWLYESGVSAVISFDGRAGTLGARFDLLSEFAFFVHRSSTDSIVGINLVPFAVLIYFLRTAPATARDG